MATNSFLNYTTASSFVDYEKELNISHSKVHLKSRISTKDIDLIVNSTSFGNKYFDYLMSASYVYTFTDKEFLQYKYQPKLFCFNKYGSTELWSLLLKINHMVSVTDFNRKSIRAFYSSVYNVINEILVLERPSIIENTEKVYDK